MTSRLPRFGSFVFNTFNSFMIVGVRKDVLQRLVGLYKLKRAKSASMSLADLPGTILP
jgi:hypothetical protein